VTQGNGSPGTPLPVRPRPRQGETADSYLRRLAAANHLRFSYLRRYLAMPPGSYGPIDAAGLAVLAGRKPHAILRAFPEMGPPALRHAKTGRRYTREDIQHAYAAKEERYAVIRRDFDAGTSERAIERKHHVGRRTIIKALDSADPPARKKIHREPAALKGLHGRIDAMIEADPAIATATIWQRLADDHGATVAYPTLRTYVNSRRAALRAQLQPPLACPLPADLSHRTSTVVLWLKLDGTGFLPFNSSQARAGNRDSVLAGRWSVPPEGPDG
jgi:hypothetical protein